MSAIMVRIGDDNIVVASPKRFASGNLGYWGNARVVIDDCVYMAQVQLVAISTQSPSVLATVAASIGAAADAAAAAKAAKAAAATTTPSQRAALDNARARKK